MKRSLLLVLMVLLGARPGAAERIDDSDLAPWRARPAGLGGLAAEGRLDGDALRFPLAAMPGAAPPASPGRISGVWLLVDGSGSLVPARSAKAFLVGPDGRAGASAAIGAGGAWELAAPWRASGLYRVRLALEHSRWTFRRPGPGGGYSWESEPFRLPATGWVSLGVMSPVPGSENAKLGAMHLLFLGALDTLASRGIAAGDWRRPLAVHWPDEADYFLAADFSLHLTAPLAWDVELHEFGHAVMHGAMRAEPAGGRHKIDECYTPALAWSEGWAVFFAAAMRFGQDDEDPKFEFLVPRRAPIRIENVPEDVCRGQGNEWRVAATLWDFYDARPDGEDRIALPLARLWNAWAGARIGSLLDYAGLLGARLSPSEREALGAALRQNTIDGGGGGGLSGEAPEGAPDFEEGVPWRGGAASWGSAPGGPQRQEVRDVSRFRVYVEPDGVR